MSHLASPSRRPSPRQIATAAESYAAAQFALCGFDILEQASRADYHYDLGVARADGMMKVAVHASVNGFWDLADRHLDASLRNCASIEDYHCAIDAWQEQHSENVVCCLVEFEPNTLNQIPHIYLADPWEVAEEMHERVDHLGGEELGTRGLDIVLHQQELPVSWRFSEARIAELMENPDKEETFDSSAPADLEFRESAAVMLLSEMQFAVVN